MLKEINFSMLKQYVALFNDLMRNMMSAISYCIMRGKLVKVYWSGSVIHVRIVDNIFGSSSLDSFQILNAHQQMWAPQSEQ